MIKNSDSFIICKIKKIIEKKTSTSYKNKLVISRVVFILKLQINDKVKIFNVIEIGLVFFFLKFKIK